MISLLALLAAVWLIGPAGTAVVRGVLHLCGPRFATTGSSTSHEALRSGWIIGYLERALILVGVLFGSWEVIAAVIALKTVSRYKELDDQIPAEYFLVGSLASLAWAVAVAVGLIAVDGAGGDGWIQAARTLVGST